MFNKGKKLFRVEIKVHGRIVYLLDSIYTRFYSLLISIFPSFCINFSIFVFQIIDNTMVKKNFLMTAPLLMASFCSAQEKPNVVLIMVDDMGYSDIGCYGGEILTPNIDALASKGVRFTQFYNTSRSCPTRASLMTGLYQHQTGIGQMSEDPFNQPNQKSPNDWGVPGYKGFLNRNCVTIAEVLKESGYHTYMAGKWHLGMHGEEKWPLQRGFERFYGILAGACSYLRPSGGRGLTLDNTKLPVPEAPYYTTDAFTDYAIRFVDEQKDDKPFFLYLAFNAPHWPLQAKEEDIQKFTKIYREKGWDEIREARRKRMTKLGIIEPNTEFAEWENRKWNELTEQEKDKVAYRMAVYAAQVHCVDYNVRKLLDYLKKNRKLDNTLVMFLSDNGACAEPYAELGGGNGYFQEFLFRCSFSVHIQADVFLCFCFRRDVRHRNITSVSVLRQYFGYGKTGLHSTVESVRKDPLNFLRCMERAAV